MDKRLFILSAKEDDKMATEFCTQMNNLCRLRVELCHEYTLTHAVEELIAASELVIFLLTESSAKSQAMFTMLKYASDMNKRFLPINMEKGISSALRVQSVKRQFNFRTDFINYNDEDGFIEIYRFLTSFLGLTSDDIVGVTVGVVINFNTDSDCHVKLDNNYLLTVKAGTTGRARVVWGKHSLKFIYTIDDDCFLNDTIHLEKGTESIDYNIELDRTYKTNRVYINGRYEGEARLGMRDGKGTMSFFDGSSYSGNWERDTMHGEGVFKFNERHHYKGRFKHGYADGEGKYTNPNYTYKGNWKNGLKEGKGTSNYSGGPTYEGDYHNSKFEGDGKLTFSISPFSRRYVGRFKNGHPHGKGKMIFADHGSYDGEWNYGVIEGKGVLEYPNGDKYEGDFKFGKKHGEGTYTFCTGESYTGSWDKDTPKGYGIYKWRNGYSFKGTFDGGFVNGVLHDPDNNVVESKFKPITSFKPNTES